MGGVEGRVRGLRKRAATRAAGTANAERESAETTTRQRWGGIPQSITGLPFYGCSVDRTPTNLRQQATRWQQRAEQTRRDLAGIEALHVSEAAQLIRDRAQQKQARREAPEHAQPRDRPEVRGSR